MIIQGTTAGQVSASVWTAGTRQLTSLAANIAGVGAYVASLAASAVLDLRPAAGKMRIVAVEEPGGRLMGTGDYDGTNFHALVSNTVLTQITVPCGAAFGWAIQNADSSAHNTHWSGLEIS